MQHWNPPAETDYPAYYKKYIGKVPAGNVPKLLQDQLQNTTAFLRGLPSEKHTYRYAEGKWTILQIIQHLLDAERVFAYRALRFSRNDKTVLPAFEENDYAVEATLDHRSFDDLLQEFIALRHSTIALISSFTDEMISRSGIASNNPITVNSICYIIAGHELHHLAVIKERYL